MSARVPVSGVLAGLVWLAGACSAWAQEADERTYLLNISKGEKFTEIGSDDKTNPVFVDAKDFTKGLQVKFDPGDSVGQRKCKVGNWTTFKSLQIAVTNPSSRVVRLYLNVFQAASQNAVTKVVISVDVPAGEQVLDIPIESIKKEKGASPALNDVRRWYVADRDKSGPTLIFRDFWLSNSTAAATKTDAPANAAPATTPAGAAGAKASPTRSKGSGLGGRYRIRGKVGSLEVDLTLEPLDDEPAAPTEGGGGAASVDAPATPTAPTGPVYGRSDPARLERIKGAQMPAVEAPISFDTPEADAICTALEVFPADNPWNIVIEDWPVHPNSQNLVASAGAEKPLRCNLDMGFVFVPSNQKTVPVKVVGYPAESDKGPFPLPNEVPIEGWPLAYPEMTLDEVQRKKEDSDRHALVIDPHKKMLYEFYQLRRAASGWEATSIATFDLKTNKLRPKGWTSTDAAGLPVFAGVIRHDELQRGMVEHAMRFTIVKSRKSYVYPATHHAGRSNDANLPRMGERYRLKKDYDISGFSPEAQAILKGLKKYGMFVADNGQDWAMSMAPDKRIGPIAGEIRKVKGGDFEVVEAPAGYVTPQ
ncbi:MAG: hypothetical protein JSS02_34885 [Planctomycetes bacterium]|nr:hypothetical protein [Planctomycetota bacterium]